MAELEQELLGEIMGQSSGATSPDQPPLSEVEKGLFEEIYGSIDAASYAITGDKPDQPEKNFLNPYTGQMTTRELLRGRALSDVTRAGTAAGQSADAATFGGLDEAAWVAGLLRGPAQFGTRSDRAKFEQEARRAWKEAAWEKYPGTSFVSSVAGGMAVPAGVLDDVRNAPTALQATGRAATGGAMIGGGYAIGEGEGLSRVTDAWYKVPIGAAGGAIAVPVARAVAWAGRQFGKPLARVFGDKRYYVEGQGLTRAGKEALEALGYSTDEVSDAFAREFSDASARQIDPQDAARAAEMAEFGIPAYKHNVSGNVDDFAAFEGARRGPTSVAGERVRAAAAEQDAAMNRAIDNTATDFSQGVRGDTFDAASGVTNKLDDIAAAERAAAKAAYKSSEAAGLAIDPRAASDVHARVASKLAKEEIDVSLTLSYPKASTFMNTLKARGGGDDFVPLKRIDELRKEIRIASRRATDMDARALRIIKTEYDAWADDVIDAKLFRGDVEGLDELKKARALWGEYARKFQGDDATSKFLQDAIDADASPEQVMNWMFGATKLGRGRMTSKVAGGLKKTLGADSAEWNMVRQAAFRRITQKPGTENVAAEGAMRWGAQKVSENMLTFLDSPATRPLAAQLFTAAEQAKIRRLAFAVKRMVPPPGAVNYSGTAYENARNAQKAWRALVSTLGFAQGGVVGAAAANTGAQAVEQTSGWLAGRALTRSATSRPWHVPASGVGAVTALATPEFIEELLRLDLPRQESSTTQ